MFVNVVDNTVELQMELADAGVCECENVRVCACVRMCLCACVCDTQAFADVRRSTRMTHVQ